jgi:hypothetical protein
MPRTSQSAGFDIGAFYVTTRYTHNVKKFVAQTAPGNYLHSTKNTKRLIWYKTTAGVVCANVLYFPNSPRNNAFTARKVIWFLSLKQFATQIAHIGNKARKHIQLGL